MWFLWIDRRKRLAECFYSLEERILQVNEMVLFMFARPWAHGVLTISKKFWNEYAAPN